jgi:hypothetical protein
MSAKPNPATTDAIAPKSTESAATASTGRRG